MTPMERVNYLDAISKSFTIANSTLTMVISDRPCFFRKLVMALKTIGALPLVGMMVICSSSKYGYQESGTMSETVEVE